MSDAEYLDFLLRLAQTIRQSIPSVDAAKVKAVLAMVKHPMFPLLVQWMSNATSQMLKSDSSSEDNPPAEPNDATASPEANTPSAAPTVRPQHAPNLQPFAPHSVTQPPQMPPSSPQPVFQPPQWPQGIPAPRAPQPPNPWLYG